MRDQDKIIDWYEDQRDTSRQQLLLDRNKSAHRRRMRALYLAQKEDPRLATAVYTERDFMIFMRKRGFHSGSFAIHAIVKSNANDVMHKMPDCWVKDENGNVFLVEVKAVTDQGFSIRTDVISEYLKWNTMQKTFLFLFHRKKRIFSFIGVEKLPHLVEGCQEFNIGKEKHRDGSQKKRYEVPLSKITHWMTLDNHGERITLQP